MISARAFSVALACFAAGWLVQYWRLGEQMAGQEYAYKAELARISQVASDAQRRADEQRQALAKAVQQQSAAQYEEYINVQAENAQLRADLRDAKRRLSVRVSGCSAADVPAASNAGNVDHESSRAYLDPRDSAALLAIVGRGDDAIRQLTACQAHIRVISGKDNGR
ncbi:lysis system i-spanin subunit Rz [Pseudomonas aeruginosa]|uniref:lysis system i-spanin subunit Rz n=1 Tax=Pseudomonas aeruginosa TaxID=287 RepID=UPI0009A3259D|nr:lysis system i-spanin subunit Rz [Pseudomonas aeruginosa]EKV0214140.1 lysis protein [Pseudomonas aeruginosa]EKX2550812.1 lysis protein [Pseudomonas aeruginosa]EKX5071195.1 lysis protein [Pseudomonas aeruginosa]EKX5234778.1 lysis protein [Pseudomonas aeruginosa]MBH4296724.1 lysis protein [Pseudomonas aeruginosa]